ncbi:MAG: hypothetical protein IPK16_10615 [Anaerolineales bacterium]|nr:hypothetical protein [Anaerolineales bacterium]
MSKHHSSVFVFTIVFMVCLLAGALDLSVSAQAATQTNPAVGLQDPSQPSMTPPGNHPTGTPGHPPTATPTGQPTPGPVVLDRLEPNQGLASVPNQVRIFGANLRQGLRLTIAGMELRNITEGCTDGSELSAVIPAGIPPGLHDVVASMSNQPVYTLTAGYTAIGADGLDLAVNDYDLWFFPQGVRVERETQVGVNVHRSGGSEVVTPTVQFYLNDPVTGTLLGETTTPPLEAGTNVVGKAVITWTPPITGTFIVYAVVDPANVIAEASETNNAARASVEVRLPKYQFSDITEPLLHRFTVQHQHQVTTMPTVTLALTATDNEGGSGLASMFMMEHMYNNATRQWEMRQQTGWIPYTNTHAFALSPDDGAHYLQAWVGDAAGNVTRTASRTMINFAQANTNMVQGQVHLYRYELQANESFQARLTIGTGDAGSLCLGRAREAGGLQQQRREHTRNGAGELAEWRTVPD